MSENWPEGVETATFTCRWGCGKATTYPKYGKATGMDVEVLLAGIDCPWCWLHVAVPEDFPDDLPEIPLHA